jgi:hypothetical protein
MHVGLILTFQADPVSGYVYAPECVLLQIFLFRRFNIWQNHTDIVHTLLRLLGNSVRSSVHQCPTECMFSFENGPDIEAVSNTSEFLGDTLNIWDNGSVLVYCI